MVEVLGDTSQCPQRPGWLIKATEVRVRRASSLDIVYEIKPALIMSRAFRERRRRCGEERKGEERREAKDRCNCEFNRWSLFGYICPKPSRTRSVPRSHSILHPCPRQDLILSVLGLLQHDKGKCWENVNSLGHRLQRGQSSI